MNKQSKSSSFQSPFSDDWTDHPTISWITSNKNLVLWGLLVLFAALILTYRFLSVQALNAEADFMQASAAFQQIEQNTASFEAQKNSIQTLLTIMSRHPELHAKYDGALAQYFIIHNQIAEAKPLAEATFKRVKPDQLNLYESYAKATLLISEGSYQQALLATNELQKQLASQPQQTDMILSVYNLIRSALLHEQLNQTNEAATRWDILLNQSQQNPEIALITAQLFQTGQMNLEQFIKGRKATETK